MAKLNNNNHEIERRWIVSSIPKEISIQKLKFTDIVQTYISKKPVIRLRSHDKKEFVLCVKTQGKKKTLARPEQETTINKKEYNSLMKISVTESIIKRRYFFKYKNRTVELDVFGGYLKGMIIIEVEFQSESEAHSFEAPEWFGREITGMRKYANSSLAKLKEK